MSRIFIADDAGTIRVEVTQDDEGYAHAGCACGWETDRLRSDTLHDVTEEASIHVDLNHEGTR